MLKTPYSKPAIYSESDRNYANDLKIFIGRRIEIAQLEAENRIVDKKWYLSWDTGEFFVANSMRKLVRYGGTANNLSKEDIEKIVDEYTKDDIELIRSQLVSALKNYNDVINKTNQLEKDFQETVNRLENHTLEYILKQIDKVLEEMTNIAYTREEVDQKLLDLENKTNQNISSNYVNNDKILEYAKTEYVDQSVSNRLIIETGNNISKLNTTKQSGYYFCILDSTNKEFEIGHIYNLNNGDYTDITAGGTGGGPVQNILSLLNNGHSEILQEICSNFTGNKTFSYTISNPKDIKGKLVFFENGNKTNLEIDPKFSGSFPYMCSLTNLNVGNYNYTISGETKKGELLKSDFTINVVAPIFYGTTQSISPIESQIKSSNKKLLYTPAGKYQFTTKPSEYIFVAIPSTMHINKFEMNGFTVPMTGGETVFLSFKDANLPTAENYTISYTYYRSQVSAESETFTVDII